MENYSEILVERLQREVEQAQLSKTAKQEANMFLEELLTIPLDQRKIRELAYGGCPDSIRGIRPTVWKVLLGYLPANFSKWEHLLHQRREEYSKFVKLCLEAENFPDHKQYTQDHSKLIEENKLNEARSTQMIDLWENVEKDMERTRKDMNFFSQLTGVAFDPNLLWLSRSKSKTLEKTRNNNMQSHRDVITRLLFVFARTNPGLGYAQGMNEVAAVLYHCFFSMGLESDKKFAEADTFWCLFQLLLGVAGLPKSAF